MKISQAFPTKYLSAADLQGREVQVTISHVTMEDVGDHDVKPVVYFQGKNKGLVLNKTNASAIAMIYGDESDNWAGGQLVLFTIQTEFQGRPVQGLRVKIPAQPVQQAQPAPPPVNPGTPNPDEMIDDNIPF